MSRLTKGGGGGGGQCNKMPPEEVPLEHPLRSVSAIEDCLLCK